MVKKHKSRRGVNKPLLFGVLLFILSISGYAIAALTKPLPEISPNLLNTPTVAAENVVLPWPSGQGVLGTLDEGVLAASSDNQSVKPIASMTKVVTALAVLQKLPMQSGETGKMYTLTQADVAIYQDYVSRFGSVMAVRAGQQISQYQALQALLLPSANNIADTLAIAEFGSVDLYVQYANSMLKDYGLQNTTIADASGFSPNTVSTPRDMFEIGRRALANPIIAEIVMQKEAQIPGSGIIRNTNQLLNDDNVIGMKTGTTDEAGSCLLFAFSHVLADGTTETVIGTVMGVPSWPQLYREVRSFMDVAKQSFGSRDAVKKGSVVGSYQAPWGDSADIIVTDDVIAYGWVGIEQKLSVEAETIRTPIEPDQTVGVIRMNTTSIDLETADSIEPPSVWWRLAHYW